MRRNSGIIGPKTAPSFETAEGSHEGFDQFNARKDDSWPLPIISSISVSDTTLYRGNTYSTVSWSLDNIPPNQTKKYRVVYDSNYAISGSTIAASRVNGITNASPTLDLTTLEGSLTGTSGTISFRAQLFDSLDVYDTDVSFQIEIYGDNEGVITVYATSDTITIPATTVVGPSTDLPSLTFTEGSTTSLVWTFTNVQQYISYYLEIENGTSPVAKFNYSNNQYVGQGSYNSTTKTATVTVNVLCYKAYQIGSSYTGNIRMAIKPTSTSTLSMRGTGYKTVTKTTSAPTITPTSGQTLIEYQSNRYQANFTEYPVTNITYQFSGVSSSTFGATSGNMIRSTNMAYVDKTYTDHASTTGTNIYFTVKNQWGETIANSSYTMQNATPIIQVSPTFFDITSPVTAEEDAADRFGPTATKQPYRINMSGSGSTSVQNRAITYDFVAVNGGTFDPYTDIKLVENGQLVSWTGARTVTPSSNLLQVNFIVLSDELTEGTESFQVTATYEGYQRGISQEIFISDTSRPPPPPNDFDIETAVFSNQSADYFSSSPKLWDYNDRYLNCIFAGYTTYSGQEVTKFYVRNTSYNINNYYIIYYNKNTGTLFNPNSTISNPHGTYGVFGFNRTGTKMAYVDQNGNLRVADTQTAWSQYISPPDNTIANLRNQFGSNIYNSTGWSNLQFSDDGTKIIVTAQINQEALVWVVSVSASYSAVNGYVWEQRYQMYDSYVGNQTLAAARLEFNRDGTEVTLLDSDNNNGYVLSKYILSTPYDMSTKAATAAYQTSTLGIPNFSGPTSRSAFLISAFLFDRLDEDKLYVFGSISSSYYHVWDYTISTIIRLEDKPGYAVSSAELIDYNRGYNWGFDTSGLEYTTYGGRAQGNGLASNAPFNTNHHMLAGSYLANSSSAKYLEFTPNYSAGGTNIEFNGAQNNYTAYAWLRQKSGSNNYDGSGAALINYANYNNSYVGGTAGTNYFLFNQMYADYSWQQQFNRIMKMFPVYDQQTNTGFIIISYTNQYGERYIARWDHTSRLDNSPNFNGSATWNLYLGNNNNATRLAKFQFNKNGTEVTRISTASGAKLDTYDISEDPYNISLTTNKSPVRSLDLLTSLNTIEGQNGQGWFYPTLIDFAFEMQSPKRHLYLITTSSSGSNSINRYTYIMDAEYNNYVGNTFSNGLETLDAYDVTVSGSVVDLTFTDTANAAKFETFMTDFLNISEAYVMRVYYQGTRKTINVGAGTGKSVSRSSAVVSIDFNGAVTSTSDSESAYAFNTIEFKFTPSAVNANTSTNTISAVLGAGTAANILNAFDNSGCGIGTASVYTGAPGDIFYSNNSLFADVAISGDTLGLGFEDNLSSLGGAFETTLVFNLSKNIIGTGTATITAPAVLLTIKPDIIYSNGSSFIDFSFNDPATKDKMYSILAKIWDFNLDIQIEVSDGNSAYFISTGGMSLNNVDSTSFGLYNLNTFFPLGSAFPARFQFTFGTNTSAFGNYILTSSDNNINSPPYYVSTDDSFVAYEFYNSWSKYLTTAWVALGGSYIEFTGINNVVLSPGYPSLYLYWNASSTYYLYYAGFYEFIVKELKFDPNAFELPYDQVQYIYTSGGSSVEIWVANEADRDALYDLISADKSYSYRGWNDYPMSSGLYEFGTASWLAKSKISTTGVYLDGINWYRFWQYDGGPPFGSGILDEF